MKEIKEVECECCARLFGCCREPTDVKELDMMGGGNMRFSTVAVLDADSGNTGNVKECEFDRPGWHWTRFPNMMTKLIQSTKTE